MFLKLKTKLVINSEDGDSLHGHKEAALTSNYVLQYAPHLLYDQSSLCILS